MFICSMSPEPFSPFLGWESYCVSVGSCSCLQPYVDAYSVGAQIREILPGCDVTTDNNSVILIIHLVGQKNWSTT